MRITVALLLVALVLGLCACGQTQAAPTDAATQATQAVGGEQDATTGTQDPKALAESCIHAPVADLFALIGQPESSEYAPSCMNPGVGEDGMLYYDGFVVYTYKEGDTETVDYVE